MESNILLDIKQPIKRSLSHAGICVGIDFGTTNSLICKYDGDNHLFYYDEDVDIIPSIIAIHRDGSIVLGQKASLLQHDDDYLIIRSIKRLIGTMELDRVLYEHDTYELRMNQDNELCIVAFEKLYSIKSILILFFSHLKTLAEKSNNMIVEQCIITVPTYFGTFARNIIKNAATATNMNILRIVNEPNAAAMAYGLDTQREGIYIVYDLGGGTFDVSIIRIMMGVFQVIAVGGDNMLGGDDIDIIIREFLIKKYQNINNVDDISRALKHQLATEDVAIVDAVINEKKSQISLNIEEFNALIKPMIDRSIAILDDTIRRSAQNINSILGIILVGGSTRIRLIGKLLCNQYKKMIVLHDLDPDKSVVIGAAIRAYELYNNLGNILIDVVPISISIESVNGMCDKVISRGTPIPTSAKHSFTTFYDNQVGIVFNILQGESHVANECQIIGTFKISNIPKMPRATIIVQVEFAIDIDGILAINVINNITDEHISLTVDTTRQID